MRIKKLLDRNSLFFAGVSDQEIVDHVKNIREISRAHVSTKGKLDIDESWSTRRPTELDESLQWRNNNYRQYLKSEFNKFVWKSSSRINELTTDQNRSDILTKWLNSKPFTILHQKAGEQEYKEKVFYTKALANPMRLGPLAFPYRPSFGMKISPLKGNSRERVLPKPMIIEFEDIHYLDEDGTFSFEYEKVDLELKLPNGKVINRQEPRYFSADDKYWYVHDPEIKINNEGKVEIEYISSLWYRHNSGQSLFSLLPGKVEESWNGNFECLTSLIDGFFEIAEAAKQAFSDEGLVRTIASYPIRVIIPQECSDTNCLDGYDKERVSKIGRVNAAKCKNCGGHGKVMAPNPAGFYVKNKTDTSFVDPATAKQQSDEDPIKFIGPDLSYPKFAFETAWSLYDRARKSLWLDCMDGAGLTASGEALQRRQEDFNDAMHMISKTSSNSWNRFLWACECILVKKIPGRENRMMPSTIVPIDMSIKSADQLMNEAKDSLPENYLYAKMAAYDKKYKDDVILSKIHRITLLSYPIFSLKDDQRIEMIAQKCLPKIQLFAQMLVPFLLKDISKNPSFEDTEDEEILRQLRSEVERQFNESDVKQLQDQLVPVLGVGSVG